MKFTIEHGRGETYSNSRPTVYRHDTYPRGSVLAGRQRRTWVNDYATIAEAKAAHPDAVDLISDGGGSTHVPVDVLTAGLPDTEDY